MLNRWHADTREVILHLLGTHPARGLEPAESSRRLRERGPNLIREPEAPSRAGRLARAFLDVPALILLAAAAAAGELGGWIEAGALLAIVVLNGLLGASRERCAARPRAALGHLTAPGARVIRGGRSCLIPAAELVPGDLVEVAVGDRVPADMRLFAAEQLFVDESALTGEPLPVGKDPALILAEEAPLADRGNMLFSGTLVTAGRGLAVVTATGMLSEVGRIARLLGEVRPQRTPLQRRFAESGALLAAGFPGLLAVAFAASRVHGRPFGDFLIAAVALAAAAVPVGLPVVIAAILSAGTRRLARSAVSVRRPSALEALGSIGVICTDKTGTLTQHAMTVRELFLEGSSCAVTGDGYAPEGLILHEGRPVSAPAWETLAAALEICVLCNGTRLVRRDGGWEIVGDPSEGALLTLAAKAGFWREDLAAGNPIVAEFPSSAERKRMTVLVDRGGRSVALTKGAPDIVLAHCLHQRTPAGVRPLAPADRERILRQGEAMSGRALRVLGLAYREDVRGEESLKIEHSMVWVGLVGMLDPPRPEVQAAVARCREAGVGTVIVTGDQKPAALAIAGEIGALRPGDEALTGEELNQLTQEALGVCVERYRVYARVTAEHKLRIVRAWKSRGHLVAMTGDGVNDAPALREADIGIARGREGTAVTPETADVVLADDNFAQVAAAVEEGRSVAEKITKVAAYLISCNLGELLALLLGMLAGLPLLLVPLQLLWANAVSAGLPAFALGREPFDPARMSTPRRLPRERSLSGETAPLLLVEGAVLAAVALTAFLLVWKPGGGDVLLVARARTHAFVVLALAQIVHVFNCRHAERSFFSRGIFSNPSLFGAAALAALLLVALVQTPFLQPLFGTVALAPEEWGRALLLGLAPLPAIEAVKLWVRGRREREAR